MSDGDPYESGPFCLHWGEPGDCDELCSGCGHPCNNHDFGLADCRICPCEKQTKKEKPK